MGPCVHADEPWSSQGSLGHHSGSISKCSSEGDYFATYIYKGVYRAHRSGTDLRILVLELLSIFSNNSYQHSHGWPFQSTQNQEKYQDISVILGRQIWCGRAGARVRYPEHKWRQRAPAARIWTRPRTLPDICLHEPFLQVIQVFIVSFQKRRNKQVATKLKAQFTFFEDLVLASIRMYKLKNP